MKIKLLIVASLIIFALSAPLFAGGTSEKDAGEQESGGDRITAVETAEKPVIRVGTLKGPTGIGLVKIMDAVPDADELFTVEYEVTGAPDVLVSRILAGEIDVATLPSNLTANLYNKGVDYSLGAVTGMGLIYLVTSDPDISSLDDLKGKRVHNAGKGATPDILFRYLLSENGIDPDSDLEISFSYSHTELAQLLIAGKVSTALLPEPFVTMVISKNPDLHIGVDLQTVWSDIDGNSANYPISAVLVKKSLLDEHPAAAARFFKLYEESIMWVKNNPEQAGPLSEKVGIGLPASVAAAAIPRLNLTFIPSSESRPVMEPFLKIFLEFAPPAVGGKMVDDGFYREW